MSGTATVTLPDGTQRRLGNNPPSRGLLRAWPVYGDTPTAPMIARSSWKPIDLSRFVSPIKDQDGEGACNAFSTVNVVEACRRMAGLPDVTLSPGYLYGNINGQRDQGSLLEDALAWMMQHGTCTAQTVPELDWQERKWPAGAADEAKKYRITEAFLCPTFEHVASALQCGFFVSVGIMWFNNFNPDADGWIPGVGRGQAGGHALMRAGLEHRNGVWGASGPNSWGPGWGKQGFFTIPETLFDDSVGGFWAVRSVTDEGGIIPGEAAA